MAKTWVLDTETKGTGAHVAPLPARGAQRERERELAFVQLQRPPRPEPAPEPASAPRRFKVVHVPSGRVLGEDLDTRATVAALAALPSAIDARVYVWREHEQRWRLTSLAQTRALWELRAAR